MGGNVIAEKWRNDFDMQKKVTEFNTILKVQRYVCCGCTRALCFMWRNAGMIDRKDKLATSAAHCDGSRELRGARNQLFPFDLLELEAKLNMKWENEMEFLSLSPESDLPLLCCVVLFSHFWLLFFNWKKDWETQSHPSRHVIARRKGEDQKERLKEDGERAECSGKVDLQCARIEITNFVFIEFRVKVLNRDNNAVPISSAFFLTLFRSPSSRSVSRPRLTRSECPRATCPRRKVWKSRYSRLRSVMISD